MIMQSTYRKACVPAMTTDLKNQRATYEKYVAMQLEHRHGVRESAWIKHMLLTVSTRGCQCAFHVVKMKSSSRIRRTVERRSRRWWSPPFRELTAAENRKQAVHQ